MGMLVNGVWQDVGYDTKSGEFMRNESVFRDRVTADGSSGLRAEPGRYHLYVSLACPWAHRTLILRALKGLDETISLSVVDPYMGPEGWRFGDRPDCTRDSVNGAALLREIYLKARRDYTGRVSVPALWDRKTATIVNNESADIIRMLNREFDAYASRDLPDLYPDSLRSEIDRWNDLIYRSVNNGVYRAGFAVTQDKYETAVRSLFETLNSIEEHLGRHRYLCGARLTEADWRLFTTLVRFDAVYHGHFKCNLQRLSDFPSLWGYTRELYQIPGVAATVDMRQIKEHYYRSHARINPTGIVPLGPTIDFGAPHGREFLG
ncbi:MAG: glutathione-dependent reductase [Betaproteobacteria bacterium RIFCSPLOWO2_02_FULL_65_20]|nr:MAG: glutathione-dependent reductase [Betaproteobacteria bacterium RIFCSPLOWO2_02_FULL_65_20]